jgi:hypothetical protein
MSKTRPSFKERIESYREQTNTLPNKISLIWIGDDIPNTREHPYLNNAFRHKYLSPTSTVQIFVDKEKLIANGTWDKLIEKCSANGVVLRDIKTECQHYINYDIILTLMENKENYVWASDILRLSLMYHEGGEYFDTDIRPNPEEKKASTRSVDKKDHSRNLALGFNLFFPGGKKVSFDFSYLASVPQHFFYLYSSVISRYYYECVQEKIRIDGKKPWWLESKAFSVKNNVVLGLSGYSPLNLIRYTSLNEVLIKQHKPTDEYIWPYEQEQQYIINHDNTWLEGFEHNSEDTSVDFHTALDEWRLKINESFLLEKEKAYFGIDKPNLVPLEQKEIPKKNWTKYANAGIILGIGLNTVVGLSLLTHALNFYPIRLALLLVGTVLVLMGCMIKYLHRTNIQNSSTFFNPNKAAHGNRSDESNSRLRYL